MRGYERVYFRKARYHDGEREKEKEGAVAVASERKTGTVDGDVVAKGCVVVDFHERYHQGFL